MVLLFFWFAFWNASRCTIFYTFIASRFFHTLLWLHRIFTLLENFIIIYLLLIVILSCSLVHSSCISVSVSSFNLENYAKTKWFFMHFVIKKCTRIWEYYMWKINSWAALLTNCEFFSDFRLFSSTQMVCILWFFWCSQTISFAITIIFEWTKWTKFSLELFIPLAISNTKTVAQFRGRN